jgi:formylglycine-generating enzyme required for sulfatase activity
MERYNEIVLEPPKGHTFVVSQEGSGELRIQFIPTVASIPTVAIIPTVATEYSGDYTNPPIPEGWEYVVGTNEDGFTIQDSKGNQFVWVPVGFLNPNGTLDGYSCQYNFGRRNYRNDDFSSDGFNEEMNCELRKQWESVKKYGGFYISRYNISRINGEAKSVKGAMPWTNINWYDAMEAAKAFGDGVSVKSHLPFGAEYDSVLEWFMKSGKRTQKDVADNSTQWGNFFNSRNATKGVAETGMREAWSTNRIYDFAGNVEEWTQERYKSSYPVLRGGYYDRYGYSCPVAYRSYTFPDDAFKQFGFRAALYIA